MSADDQKRIAGAAAADLVESGMVVGLGTGSTAAWFVKALATRKLDVQCVPTSEKTADLARELGLALTTLDDVKSIDLTVDGADE
ncbi:MAG TPA: ribose-5-phosphate isomerase A, partial [Caulobacteraceae bacterium]